MSLSDSGVQAFLEGEENQNTERNTKVTNSVALVMEFIVFLEGTVTNLAI